MLPGAVARGRLGLRRPARHQRPGPDGRRDRGRRPRVRRAVGDGRAHGTRLRLTRGLTRPVAALGGRGRDGRAPAAARVVLAAEPGARHLRHRRDGRGRLGRRAGRRARRDGRDDRHPGRRPDRAARPAGRRQRDAHGPRRGRRLHRQRHLAGAAARGDRGRPRRGHPRQRQRRRRHHPALARRRRAQRRRRGRGRDPGRGAARRDLRLPLRGRPGRHVLVPLAPGLARAGAGRAPRRAGHPPEADRPRRPRRGGDRAPLRRRTVAQRQARAPPPWTRSPARRSACGWSTPTTASPRRG